MPEPAPAPPRLRDTARARTPTVIQMEAVECGAAALAMILAYHGRFVGLEELRVACGVSRNGSKASHMLRAARTYGLVANGLRKEPAQLADLPVPMIVFWNFNHFVVVEGFRRGQVFLNDPSSGPRVVSDAEFDEGFTGVVLTFETGEGFRRGGERPRMLRALRRRLRGSERALLFAVLTGLGLVVPGLAIPVFMRVFVDSVLVGQLHDWIRPLLVGMGLTALLRAALTALQQQCLLRLQTKISLVTSGQFLWHVLRLPMDFFNHRWPGEIGTRVQINDRVARVLSGELATTVVSVTTVVFYGAVMLGYDVVLTVIGVGFALVNLLALKFVTARRVNANQRLQRFRGRVDGSSAGGLQMIETLKSTGTDSEFFTTWNGLYAKALNAEQSLRGLTVGLTAVPPLLSATTTAVILAVGGLRVIDGQLTIGMLVAFQSLMSSLLMPINQLVQQASSLQDLQADMARLDDVLRYKQDPHAQSDGTTGVDKSVRLRGHVELRNVTFGYSRVDPPLVENLNLTIRPGERVALVGGSGSGKSTVARLVSGLYDPWQGEVLFDGASRADTPRWLLNNSVAVVDQDIFLFGGTIRENITLWDATLADATVGQAARDAWIHDDIAVRRRGYDGSLEEGGRNFSGGQRQRLEIARALAVNPAVLVLDEATSALDATTEKLIDDSLRRRGCTCLIVAHRLSTIRDADEIIVLDRGKVVQRGTHEELRMVADGPYSRLIES